MHATFRRYEGIAQSTEELLRAGRQLASVLGRLPGFVSYVVLEAGDGVLASVSICETQADLHAADGLLAVWEAEHLEAPVLRPPTITSGEVIVQNGL